MHRPILLATLAGASLLSSGSAFAHGFAGPHMFVSTLIIDDPNVADEASLPTFSYLPQPNDGGPVSELYRAEFEFDKRITENFGFAIIGGYQWLTQPGMKTANGWENFSGTLKYKLYVNAEHEFMMSVGVVRDFARTGANGVERRDAGQRRQQFHGADLLFRQGLRRPADRVGAAVRNHRRARLPDRRQEAEGHRHRSG